MSTDLLQLVCFWLCKSNPILGFFTRDLKYPQTEYVFVKVKHSSIHGNSNVIIFLNVWC